MAVSARVCPPPAPAPTRNTLHSAPSWTIIALPHPDLGKPALWCDGSGPAPDSVVLPGVPGITLKTIPSAPLPDADCYTLTYQSAEVRLACDEGFDGMEVVVPVGRFTSRVSQADADSRALEYAQANLACEEQVWWNTEQIVTCPENRVGDPVVVPAHSFSSTQSQNDANALAVAHGETLLVCAQTETQYYEIPFRQELTLGWYFDDASHQGAITIYFVGRVRLWASGTVEMFGNLACNRAGQSYRVWVGPTTTSGEYHVVGTTTLTNTSEDVYWVHRLEEGSYVHCVLGADIGGATWLRKLWSFDDGGWAFPIVFDNFRTSNADMDGTITRSEAAITCTGTASNYSASSAWDWWSSVTPGIAAGDWVFSGYSGVVQVSTPTYTTTAALPDSASTGIYARWYSGSPYPGVAYVTRLCSVGPFYRPEHDPAPQMGIDPMGQ